MDIKQELKILFSYLISLIRNPVQQIKVLPRIHWKTLIVFQFCLCTFSVIFSNLLAPYAISITNVIISLASSIIALSLSSLFFYYFFLIIFNKRISFLKIFTLVLFAHIPFAIFHLAANFFPPADIIGLGISGLLMIVGLVENFDVPKKLSMKLMFALYSIFIVYWMIQIIAFREVQEMSTPQHLDSIEREVQNTNF